METPSLLIGRVAISLKGNHDKLETPSINRLVRGLLIRSSYSCLILDLLIGKTSIP
jgi:hypothetical protein